MTAFTLNNWKGNNTPFLMNAVSTPAPGNPGADDRITMIFPFKVYQVSFDYAIFPDATNQQPPDFTFAADGVTQFTTLAVDPAFGPYSHSPNSGPNATEESFQFLGSSGTLFFNDGVTKLEFIDWPTQIGINNLVVNTSPLNPGPLAAPEPASLVLLACGLGGLPFLRRIMKARAAA